MFCLFFELGLELGGWEVFFRVLLEVVLRLGVLHLWVEFAVYVFWIVNRFFFAKEGKGCLNKYKVLLISWLSVKMTGC